ncbi:uncharacterized protein LOC128873328 [Hylaeus volcanicus]|uniref:uncharacterized protein LOC128873328 n=1 Tax=Hylaeus volcanicus TaxID=313075 RepID=UPI0023B7E069|nr:uncharacterized protein LOC128873328 [Hylaeus volcanicus]
MSITIKGWKDTLFSNVVYKHLRYLGYFIVSHYMTVLLNMHLIEYEYNESWLVPGPIVEYFSNINTITVLTGDKVQVNVPEIVIPQFTVPKEENNAEIPPGNFGRLTAENHNVYECYVSPYTTRQLVQQTGNQYFGSWNPLPVGAYPGGTIPNKNLLGYAEPEKLHPEMVSILKQYEFPNTNDMQGRLQISAAIDE